MPMLANHPHEARGVGEDGDAQAVGQPGVVTADVIRALDFRLSLRHTVGMESDDVIHICPPRNSRLMPCCGRAPADLPDRYVYMATDPGEATCEPSATSEAMTAEARAFVHDYHGHHPFLVQMRAAATRSGWSPSYKQTQAILKLRARESAGKDDYR